MNAAVYHIPIFNLLPALALVAVIFFIYWRWAKDARTIAYATVRMLAQLGVIGFVLIYIFRIDSALYLAGILCLMLIIASWIALRPVRNTDPALYPRALLSLTVGCLLTLVVVSAGVIRLDPWHEARYVIPLAGMIFANAMNSVSLAAERFHAETTKGVPYHDARRAAFRIALLPLINSFFAVGLVSFPGMMTGQILAGVSPLIAVRYQIMVMCMLLGAAGISSAIYLSLLKPRV